MPVRGLLSIVASAFAVAMMTALWPAQAFAFGPDLSGLARLRLDVPGVVSIEGQLLDKEQLRAFYAARGYRLAWDCDCVGLAPKTSVVVDVLMSADEQGLEPGEYHVREIAALAAAQTDADRIDRDLLITDALLHYASDVSIGRLTPRQTDERAVAGDSSWVAATVTIVAGGDAGELADFLARLAPATAEYRALRAKLAELSAEVDAGGWNSLPDDDGPSLRPARAIPWCHRCGNVCRPKA